MFCRVPPNHASSRHLRQERQIEFIRFQIARPRGSTAHAAGHRAAGRRQGHAPPDVVFVPAVRCFLSGPHQHRLCGPDDDEGPGPDEHPVWPGDHLVLHRLHLLRHSEQPRAGAHWCQEVDRLDHDCLGPGLDRDDVCDQSRESVFLSYPGGHHRSWLLAGHAAVPDVLVSLGLPGPSQCLVHDRHAGHRCRRLGNLGGHPEHGRDAGPEGLAVAVPARGSAGCHPRRGGVLLPQRLAHTGPLADEPGKNHAGPHAGG
ncbi:hypothetical protein POHY109586_24245 [Polaromonas hydrogenivorans]